MSSKPINIETIDSSMGPAPNCGKASNPPKERTKKGIGKLAGASGLVLALRLISAFLSYAAIVVLAKFLTSVEYGHYATIMSAITFGSVFCRLGTDVSTVRFLGEYRHLQQSGLALGIVSLATWVVVVLSITTAAIGTAGVYLFFPDIDRSMVLVYALSAFLILPGFAITDTQSAVIRSYGSIIAALAPKDVLWRGLVVVFAIALGMVMGKDDQRLLAITVASGVSMTVLWIWQQWYMRRRVSSKEAVVASTYEIGRWAKTSLTIWVMLIARVSFRTVDVIIVAAFLAVSTAGDYFLIGRTAELQGFLLASLNLVVGPAVASYYAAKKFEELQRYLALVSLLLFSTSLAAFLFCVGFGHWLLAWLGVTTDSAYLVLLALSFGQLVNAAAGSVGVVLNMAGFERVNASVMISTSIITVIAVFFATQFYGVLGAAFASSLGLVIWNLRLWLEVRKRTNVDPSILGGFRFVTGYLKQRAVQS